MPVDNSTEEKKNIRIAIVDADVASRKYVVQVLDSSKYKIEEYDCSEQLLTDSNLAALRCLFLSVGPGFKATRKLIQSIRRQNSCLSIIAVGDDEVTHAVLSIRAGADDYIHRPLNSGRIRAAINNLLLS